MFTMFQDRIDAGQQLAIELLKYKDNEDAVVVAIPRGGVVLGYIIARELNLPLEIEMIKKIGHPLNPELAIGAVGLNGRVITYKENIPVSYIEAETKRIREYLKSGYELYHKKPPDVKNKIVIIVDDGIATGSTFLATIDILKEGDPKKLVIAVPVAPLRTITKLSGKVDDIICLETPRDFFAIEQFYKQFDQINDDVVLQLLSDAEQFKPLQAEKTEKPKS